MIRLRIIVQETNAYSLSNPEDGEEETLTKFLAMLSTAMAGLPMKLLVVGIHSSWRSTLLAKGNYTLI